MTTPDPAKPDPAAPAALAARLIMPALDLRGGESPAFDEAMQRMAAAPWCGFLLFGGEVNQVRRITRSLRTIAADRDFPRPFFTCDVERGLGQIVQGGSLWPSLEALAACNDGEARARAMGEAIGRESLAVGIDWPFVPVLDLSDLAANPIVGARSFGPEPETVIRLGTAFVQGLESTGALACGKHFPGHGGTLADSHDTLPTVQHDADQLRSRDLAPFREVIRRTPLSSIMTAHVAYPALAEAGEARLLPATLEPAILRGVLREELGFEGIIVSDAFIMSGLTDACGGDEAEAAVRALAAGCDLILYPADPEAVQARIAAEIEQRGTEWIQPSLDRIAARKQQPIDWSGLETAVNEGPLAAARDQARILARSAMADAEVALLAPGCDLRVVVLDDDGGQGAAANTARDAGLDFLAALHGKIGELRQSHLDPDSDERAIAVVHEQLAAESCETVYLIRCSIRAWKGRPGLHPKLAEALHKGRELTRGRDRVVALGGRRVLEPLGITGLLAYGEGAACEDEAVRRLFTG